MNLEHVWVSANKDRNSLNLDTTNNQSRINFGIKITKDNHSGQIKIFNTSIGGDYYTELSISEYVSFSTLGWRGGCYELTLANCKRKLSMIENKIKSEINGKQNKRKIDALKESRERVINRYRVVSQRIQNGNS